VRTSLCGAAPLARAACNGGSRQQLLRPASRKLSSSAAGTAAKSESGFAWLMREGQVDSGFWQGSALFGGTILAVYLATDAQRVAAIDSLLQGYRWAGLSDQITDRKVIEDYVRKNAAAAVNVVYASPTFYFLFAKMHGQSWLVSSVRVQSGKGTPGPFFFSRAPAATAAVGASWQSKGARRRRPPPMERARRRALTGLSPPEGFSQAVIGTVASRVLHR
jgi:hypothetical protein